MTVRPSGPRPIQLQLHAGFIADRLRQARETAGSSMDTVALKVGRSKQAISRYEAGLDQPGAEVVLAFAQLFEQPVAFFYDPLPGASPHLTFYRKLKRVSEKEKRRAAGWRDWLEDVASLVTGYVDLPEYDVPEDLFVPFDANDVDLAVVDEAASRLREHWRLGRKPIGNLVRLLERHGVVVSRFDLGVDDIDAYSFTARDEADTPVIALNAYKSNAFRSRFDTAHELAHHLFHRNVTAAQLEDEQIYDRLERQAHRFAAAFLLPDDAFLQDVHSSNLDLMLPLKEKWGVSLGAMTYRLYDLEVISTEEFRRVRANLARRKWNKLEPLDMTTPPEQPVLLQQALDALVNDAGFTKQDILKDVKRGAGVVERIAGLPGYFSEPEDLEIKPSLLKFNAR